MIRLIKAERGKMTKELPAKVGRGQASADALSGVEVKRARYVLEVVTRWLLLLTLGQYISETKTHGVFKRNRGSTHILTFLPFLFSNSYFLGKRDAMVDVKDEAESRKKWRDIGGAPAQDV